MKGRLKMKNKIIAALIFVVPIVMFAIMSNKPSNDIVFAAQGKPVVYVFSSPMCGECSKYAPTVKKMQSKYADRIDIIKINASDSDKQIKKLVEKYEIMLVPTTVFTDKNNVQIEKAEGALPEEILVEKIENLCNR